MFQSAQAVSAGEHRRTLSRNLRVRTELRLPSPPRSLMRLQRAFRDPNFNFRAAAKLVEQDPALAASVLRVAASPLYNLARPPRTLVQAVASIGLAELQRMVLTQVALQHLAGTPQGLELFLRRAYLTALSTRALCRQYEPLLDPALAWPAGLLFGIGRLVRLSLAPDQDEAIRRTMLTLACPYEHAQAELQLQDHHQLGARLLHSWKLPLLYVDVTLYGGRTQPLSWPGTRESLGLRRLIAACDAMAMLAQERVDVAHKLSTMERVDSLLGGGEDSFVHNMAVVYELLPEVQALLN